MLPKKLSSGWQKNRSLTFNLRFHIALISSVSDYSISLSFAMIASFFLKATIARNGIFLKEPASSCYLEQNILMFHIIISFPYGGQLHVQSFFSFWITFNANF